MDTNINNDAMNKSELRSLVKKAINDVLNEITVRTTIDYKDPNKGDKILNIDPSDTETVEDIKKDPGVSSATMGNKKLKEMANVAITYELVPNVNPEDYSGKKRRIIDAMLEAGEPISKPAVAAALGYDKQNPINADFMALVAQGAIAPTNEQAAPRFATPVQAPEIEIGAEAEVEVGEEEQPEDSLDVADLFIGNIDPKSLYLGRPGTPSAETEEAEPEETELEKTEPVNDIGMSDKDYNDFVKYTDLKQALAATKSNILKLKKSKRSYDDLSDNSTEDEINRLVKLKKSLEDRLNDLLKNSSYLQSKIDTASLPAVPPPSIEDVIDDEETLDEWTMNKWKYYAGIKK
jgi:hypothetical protein